MSVSLDEVAKRAQVSTATVSRVLNNINVVHSATRARVMRAVEELNYQPNLNARTLAGGKSRTIGMIVSNLENPFFFDVYRALEAEAHKNGYEVVIAHTGYDAEQLSRSVRVMIGRRVTGLAVIVSEMDAGLMRMLSESKIESVFYDVGTPGRHVSNIRVNYRLGIERVVEYVYELGHRKLAFVGHHSALGPISEREKAFIDAVSRYGGATEWRTVADQDGLEGGRRAVSELYASGFQPTAIVCVNDFMAVGVLRGLRELGLQVPSQVSVTGFDGILLSEYCDPPLTTLYIPRDRVGQLVYRALVRDGRAGTDPGQEFLIDPDLVLRGSTGPAPH